MRDEVRVFLDSLRESKMERDLCQDRIAQLTAAATRITAVWKDVPGGGHGDPHKDEALIALAQERERLLEKEHEYSRRLLEVEQFIDRIENPEYRLILELRYVHRLKWPQIAAALPSHGVYYSDGHIFRLHGKALQEARKLWAKEHKEEKE